MRYLFITIFAIALTVIAIDMLAGDGVHNTSGTDAKTGQYIDMVVTAYCPCEKCCGEFADGITASGHRIGRGVKLIAAPPEYPFGTRMKVPGYGIAPVLDRGGAIKGNKIDLLFQSHQEALEWGVQKLSVKILK